MGFLFVTNFIYYSAFFFFCKFSHLFFSVKIIFLDAFIVYHILRRKTWNLPYLDTSVIEVATKQQNSTKCLLSFL